MGKDIIKGTMYEKQDPDQALFRYLSSQNNLYDKIRIEETEKFIEKHTDIQGIDVLEVGCGGGTWTVYFSQRVKTLTVVDTNEYLLEATKLHVKQKGLLSKVSFNIGDVNKICEGRLFDFIFLKDVLEHIHEDRIFLSKLALKLKPTGKLYLSTQNKNSLSFIIEGGYNRILGDRYWCGWDSTHLRFYTKGNLRKLLIKSGLKPLSWHGMYHIPYRFLSRMMIGRLIEHRVFHFIETKWGDKPFVNTTGWAIGVLAYKP